MIKLNIDQAITISELSQYTGLTKDQISQFFIEIGMVYLISYKKEGLGEPIALINDKIQSDPLLNKIYNRLSTRCCSIFNSKLKTPKEVFLKRITDRLNSYSDFENESE